MEFEVQGLTALSHKACLARFVTRDPKIKLMKESMVSIQGLFRAFGMPAFCFPLSSAKKQMINSGFRG